MFANEKEKKKEKKKQTFNRATKNFIMEELK